MDDIERGHNKEVTLSIGIDYSDKRWKMCVMENGLAVEYVAFGDVHAAFSYLEKTCALYPEPIIAVSSHLGTSFHLLPPFSESYSLQRRDASEDLPRDFHEFLLALERVNLKSYSLPAIKYLASVPRYRKLYRGQMGGSDKLCAVTTLLHRMRQQEAAWSEMRFFYLEISQSSRSILVVKDGHIVDAIDGTVALDVAEWGQEDAGGIDGDLIIQAFWEQVTQDLAGLMAIHHFEDVVIMDHRSLTNTNDAHGSIIDRLGDNYQYYLFPRTESDPAGFQIPLGAALFAEGLYRPGLSAEVVERLLASTTQS